MRPLQNAAICRLDKKADKADPRGGREQDKADHFFSFPTDFGHKKSAGKSRRFRGFLIFLSANIHDAGYGGLIRMRGAPRGHKRRVRKLDVVGKVQLADRGYRGRDGKRRLAGHGRKI